MKKSILYRLFGIGSIPKKVRPILESEEIILADEGLPGWFITKNLRTPRTFSKYQSSGLIGSLIITKQRLIFYALNKEQINIPLNDPKLAKLQIDVPKMDTIKISFDAADFHENWQGDIEFQIETDKALEFQGILNKIIDEKNF